MGLGGRSLHEPSKLRVADPRSGPRLCEAQRFMVPMHAQKRMKLSMNRPTPGPSQEGNSSSVPRHWLPSSGGVGGGFMAPTHVQFLEVFASHEPENAFVDFHGLTHFRFMGREQVRKEHGTFHEPSPYP